MITDKDKIALVKEMIDGALNYGPSSAEEAGAILNDLLVVLHFEGSGEDAID